MPRGGPGLSRPMRKRGTRLEGRCLVLNASRRISFAHRQNSRTGLSCQPKRPVDSCWFDDGKVDGATRGNRVEVRPMSLVIG